jgi:asparagine synthase (glutamine-hydrolysing)
MSVQFGRWNFEGEPPAPDYIEKVSATLAPYGPDSNESYSKGGIRILYRAFHTTNESHREKQPYSSPSGAVITWDGRLDNRADLMNDLRDSLTVNSTDIAIIAASYEKWGANCLGKLIGDWALSIWNPRDRSVLLAKDPIGTRHLYYSFDDKQLTWSTILDPLVLFAGKSFQICEEYIAGWFATHFPATHLTPYVNIRALPPSSAVLLRPGKHIVSKYWDFDPGKCISYRTDAEYEEHFRFALATAVERRLRSDRPVLAELSGGMDSSSIVCIADTVIARGTAECPRLDTISWFDDSYDHLEPDWNELHWISKVEQKRGRTGFHINLRELKLKEDRSQRPFTPEYEIDRFAVTPISNFPLSGYLKQYATYLMSQGYRVTLSGIGGDQPTGGGVPTPTPELQDLLVRARFVTLVHQLNAWATKMRKPRIPLLWEAVRGFFPLALGGVRKEMCPVPWLYPSFARRHRAALRSYPSRVKVFGALPSFQDHLTALGGERRLLALLTLQQALLRDRRYPYYDRDLLEFMYAIPREQIVRVGKRRSLMKRALVGIVPDELLNRRRKEFVQQEPPKDNSAEWTTLIDRNQHMVCSVMGIIDQHRFVETLQNAGRNDQITMGSIMRTLTLEFWLRHLTLHGVIKESDTNKDRTLPLPLFRLRRVASEAKRGASPRASRSHSPQATMRQYSSVS